MICTIFLKVNRLKMALEEAAALHKIHSYLGEKQNCQNAFIARYAQKNIFWRQVLCENAIRVGQ